VPRLIDPEGRTATLVDAINHLLARDGVTGLSLRAIARESRVSTSSMLHHFDSRDRLLRIAARMTGEARLDAIYRRADREGVGAFLPAPGDDDLITARAWLGWCELWRSEDTIGETMSRNRDHERLLLASVLEVRPRTHDLTPIVALIDGLTVAVCAPTRPLAPQRARDVLRELVTQGPWSADPPGGREGR
jgi:AcrR family transcriptional regulator